MGNVEELREGFFADPGLLRTVVFRMYEVSGVVGEQDALIPPFPQKGDADVDYPEAICVSRRILDRMAVVGTDHDGNVGRVYMAGALFQSNLPFSGGPRPGSAVSVREGATIEVPSYRSVAGQYLYEPLKSARSEVIRVETRYLSGVDLKDVQVAMRDFNNHLFDVDADGELMQFTGGLARSSGTGLVVAQYRFRSTGRIKAINAGTYPGQDIAIPALPPLHEYGAIAENPPQIFATLPTDFHVESDTTVLPGF